MTGALQDRGTWKGIAATLLALALLAERAAGRSFPVRFLVLAILGRAEAIARAFVARASATVIAEAIEAGCPCPDFPDLACLEEPAGLHCGAADAVLLALRLRVLAAVLSILAETDGASADRFSGWTAEGSPNGHRRPGSAPHPQDRGNAVTARRRGRGNRSARNRIRCRDRPCRDRPPWRRDWPRSIPPRRRASR
jgi:hypothetical protein